MFGGKFKKFQLLNKRGMGLPGIMVGVGVMGILIAGMSTYMDFQARFMARVERKFAILNKIDEVKTLLLESSICGSNLQNINVTDNSNWATTPQSISNVSGTKLLEVGQDFEGVKVSDIAIENFQRYSTDNTNPDYYRGIADLRIDFDMGRVSGNSGTRQILKLRADLKGTAVPGQEDQISNCNIIGGGGGNIPNCPDGDMLTFDNGQPVCSSGSGLNTFTNFQHYDMPCTDSGDTVTLPPALQNVNGVNCSTLQVEAIGAPFEIDMSTTDPQSNTNIGVSLFSFNYTAKTNGKIKIMSHIPWRGMAGGFETTLTAALYVSDGATKTLAGVNEFGNPFEKVEIYAGAWDPAIGGVRPDFSSQNTTLYGRPCCSVGGNGTVIGFYDVNKDVNYTVEVRVFRRADDGFAGSSFLWVGTLKFFDHFSLGHVEIYENNSDAL